MQLLVETAEKDKNIRLADTQMEIRTRNLTIENMDIQTIKKLFGSDNNARLCIT
jgi:hypothetical protein